MDIDLRSASINDTTGIKKLYESVAEIEGGLARSKDEITDEYVYSLVNKSINKGIIIIAVDMQTENIVGEIHCYSSGIKVFAHVLGELTIAVHPDYQGKKIGRMLFEKLLDKVKNKMPHILRVELIARESNFKAIEFYESLGFKIEGRLEHRIKSVGGGFEADIPMAWIR